MYDLLQCTSFFFQWFPTQSFGSKDNYFVLSIFDSIACYVPAWPPFPCPSKENKSKYRHSLVPKLSSMWLLNKSNRVSYMCFQKEEWLLNSYLTASVLSQPLPLKQFSISLLFLLGFFPIRDVKQKPKLAERNSVSRPE